MTSTKADKADTVCSAQLDEPLDGTAKAARLFIALEHQLGWSHDILDGGVFGEEVTAQLKSWLGQRGAVMQLIRKPGRIGQQPCDGINVYIAHCDPSVGRGVFLEHRLVADATALTELDIQLGRPTEGATVVEHPLYLVCTHGKRDRCCALNGRPVAAAMHNLFPDLVWETSHSKGHRFAPAMILLPWNYSFGRISAVETKGVITDALSGTLHEEGLRGRGIYPAPGQVAELAVRRHAGVWGLDDVARVEVDEAGAGEEGPSAVVTLADGAGSDATGAEYKVALERIVTQGVVSSCGEAPGPKKGWAAVSVVPVGQAPASD
nr:sucrase ferredoxin [Corynebacterium lactis]